MKPKMRHNFRDWTGEHRCIYCDVVRRERVDGKRGGKRFWYASKPKRGAKRTWTLTNPECFIRPLTAAERREGDECQAELAAEEVARHANKMTPGEE